MADFTINAIAAATANPYAPVGLLLVSGTAANVNGLGFQPATAGTDILFAHNAIYGDTITSEITVTNNNTWNGELFQPCAIVRSGANAGAFVGAMIQPGTSDTYVELRSVTAADVATDLGHITVPGALTNGSVFKVVYTKSTGALEVFLDSASLLTASDSTYAAESTLAAGGTMYDGADNSAYISAFSGTGVAASTQPIAGGATDTSAAAGTLVSTGLRFSLKDIDSGAAKNAVTYSTIHAVDAGNRNIIAATWINKTTDAAGLMTLFASGSVAIGRTYDLVGWNSDGTDRFHASSTAVDLSA